MRMVLVFIVKNGGVNNGGGSAPLCPLDLLEEVAEVILKQAGSFDAEVAAVRCTHLSFSNPGIPQHVGILQSLGQCCDLVTGDGEVHGVEFPDDFFNIGHFGARGRFSGQLGNRHRRRLPGGQYRGQQMLSTLWLSPIVAIMFVRAVIWSGASLSMLTD